MTATFVKNNSVLPKNFAEKSAIICREVMVTCLLGLGLDYDNAKGTDEGERARVCIQFFFYS